MEELADITGLLSEIKDIELRQFMSEAAGCYFAGAYRGVIVISSLALFHDLRHKIKELSHINRDAKTISDEVERRIKGQELYESYLADKLGSVGICSALDIDLIERIKDHRNKAAHPSGHNPSAEEARYVYFETITRFLAKPTLYTTQAADMLLNRLKSDNYFPSNSIGDVEVVVRDELKNLHPGVLPYLVITLIKQAPETSGSENKNIRFFLAGLSLISRSDKELEPVLEKHVIKEKSSETAFGDLILGFVYNNPRLLIPEDEVIFSRIKGILASKINETKFSDPATSLSHPSGILASIVSEYGIGFLASKLKDETNIYMNRFPYDSRIVNKLLDDPALKEEYYQMLLDKAGSTTYDIRLNINILSNNTHIDPPRIPVYSYHWISLIL